MYDFRYKKAKNMYHKELADSMKHFKEEGRSIVQKFDKYYMIIHQFTTFLNKK